MECDKCKSENLKLINIKNYTYDTLNPDNDERFIYHQEMQFECLDCGYKEIYFS